MQVSDLKHEMWLSMNEMIILNVFSSSNITDDHCPEELR